MSLSVGITFDVSGLTGWTDKTLRILKNGLRSAVDKSARAARSDTLQVLADDANVPLQRLKEYLPVSVGSTQTNLTAVWNIKPNRSMIRGANFAT